MTDRDTLEAQVVRGLAELADAVPVVHAVSRVPVPARRGRRDLIPVPVPHRRGGWLVPLAAAAAAVLVTIGTTFLVTGPRPVAPPAGPTQPRATFPDRFARQPTFISPVHRAPPGRAIAAIRYAGLPLAQGNDQIIVVGADRDSYRTVPEIPAEEVGAGPFLSPDGTRLVAGSGGGDVRLVDLRTGAVRDFPADGGSGDPLAFSPDGHRLVRSLQTGTYLLDLRTGASSLLQRLPAVKAAFAPDGSRVAVQTESGGITVLDRSGRRVAVLTPEPEPGDAPADLLINNVAWSPDGRWIAVHHTGPRLSPEDDGPDGIRFLGADGRTRADQEPPLVQGTQQFLGWWSADRFLADRRGVISARPLWGGRAKVLSRYDDSVFVAGVPAGLVRDVEARRAGEPDFGPWPWWAKAGLAVAVGVPLAVVALAVLVWRRARRRSAPAG